MLLKHPLTRMIGRIVAGTWVALAWAGGDPGPLVARLANDRHQERETAQKTLCERLARLESCGEKEEFRAILMLLREAARSEDVELQARAKEILSPYVAGAFARRDGAAGDAGVLVDGTERMFAAGNAFFACGESAGNVKGVYYADPLAAAPAWIADLPSQAGQVADAPEGVLVAGVAAVRQADAPADGGGGMEWFDGVREGRTWLSLHDRKDGRCLWSVDDLKETPFMIGVSGDAVIVVCAAYDMETGAIRPWAGCYGRRDGAPRWGRSYPDLPGNARAGWIGGEGVFGGGEVRDQPRQGWIGKFNPRTGEPEWMVRDLPGPVGTVSGRRDHVIVGGDRWVACYRVSDGTRLWLWEGGEQGTAVQAVALTRAGIVVGGQGYAVLLDPEKGNPLWSSRLPCHVEEILEAPEAILVRGSVPNTLQIRGTFCDPFSGTWMMALNAGTGETLWSQSVPASKSASSAWLLHRDGIVVAGEKGAGSRGVIRLRDADR